MATPDRTTIRAALDELVDKLRANLVADPPTATQPFRMVIAGGSSVVGHARPFLAIELTRARPIGAIDGDRMMEITTALRIVTDVATNDPFQAALDQVGAVDDYLDSLLDVGVLDGADGFDDRIWEFDGPGGRAASRVVTATATQTFVVKVERNQNRLPAA